MSSLSSMFPSAQKKRLGFFILLPGSIVLLIGILLLSSLKYSFKPVDAFTVSVKYPDHLQEISLWEKDSSTVYCFLPGNVSFSSFTFRTHTDRPITIDGSPVSDDLSLPSYQFNTPYVYQVGNQILQIVFLQSESIPTLFINCGHDSVALNSANTSKSVSNKIQLSVYDATGKTDYQSLNYMTKLKGHGNSTWLLEKKPYHLTLADEVSLLGMGASREWILLANGYDETNIRDAFIYSYAAEIGFEWTPQYRFVQVYINHEFQGLYLLSEKVEISEQRLNVSLQDTCLLEANSLHRLDKTETGFVTDHGREFEIDVPKACNLPEKDSISQRVQYVENLIMNTEEDGDVLSREIDYPSWIRKYLVDELFLNCDSERLSAFYYYDMHTPNSRIYAGPIWDYDLALANPNTTWSYRWQNPNRMLSHFTLWYTELMKKNSFREETVETYQKLFRPLLIRYLSNDMDFLLSSIQRSSVMNRIRWEDALPWKASDETEAVEKMRTFLWDRLSYLDDVLLNTDAVYHTVTFHTPTSSEDMYFEIREGSLFSQFEYIHPIEDSLSGFVGWYDTSTGQAYDFSQPITADLSLYAALQEKPSGPKSNTSVSFVQFLCDWVFSHKGLCVSLLCCVVFGISLLTLVCDDIKHNGGYRK